jgi:3-hydroxybutyryl-CoA dehydrogenase
MAIKQVGIVGCGQMGSGIAEVCARAGYTVVVSEADEALLKRGLASIEGSLARAVSRGKMTEADKGTTLKRISGTTSMEGFKDCQLVIEAVVENMAEKRKVFAALDGACREDAILASNTSCLSVTEMAVATKRPDKVLGIHFFNPVPVMKPVELVRTILTSGETIAAARDFAQSLGKSVVVSPDTPGFIVNRLLTPYLLDAVGLLESGIASREDIDQAVSLGLNHPMGPLALADLIGLDTLYSISTALYDEFKDPRYAAPPLLRRMVLARWLGRKTGKGFYDYPKDKA